MKKMFFVYTPQDEGSCFDAACQSASYANFCAYHGTTSGPEMFYSVLPDFSTDGMATKCGTGSEFQNVTAVSSHELVEATTDPEIGLATGYETPLAWYDQANGEIADICLGYAGDIVFPDGRQYRVQAQWSNRQNACVFSGGVASDNVLKRTRYERLVHPASATQPGTPVFSYRSTRYWRPGMST
jgi:hypothetical protein